ncbi:MAG: hypothetical protein V1487_04110 [bacterium]
MTKLSIVDEYGKRVSGERVRQVPTPTCGSEAANQGIVGEGELGFGKK